MEEIVVEPEKLENKDSLSDYIPNYLWNYFKTHTDGENVVPSEKAKSIEFDILYLPDSSIMTTLNVVYDKVVTLTLICAFFTPLLLISSFPSPSRWLFCYVFFYSGFRHLGILL